MAFIPLSEPMPGIRGLMLSYPETAAPLNALANALLVKDKGINRYERELIAAYVSRGNQCKFCHRSHRAFAEAVALPEELQLAQNLFDQNQTPDVAGLSPKMQALLAIADQVRVAAWQVTPDMIENARKAGADDETIHDAVLIAALFCMYNRYVDGLGTFAPDFGDQYYDEAAKRVTDRGYRV